MSGVDVWGAGERTLTMGEKARLGLEALGLHLRSQWTLRRHGLPAALDQVRAGHPALASAPEGERERLLGSLRLSRAVLGSLRLAPRGTRCLSRSLVLTGLLSRRGVEGPVVIGVKPGEAFGAHAWVEVDGVAVLPEGHEEGFERLVAL